MAVMNNVFLHLHPVRVRQHAVKFAYTFCLGGLSFFLFLVLIVTGVFLMFFYVPSSTSAYDDILRIQAEVPFGQLTRNVHRWGAHLMVFFVFLHMMRVFYHGAYTPILIVSARGEEVDRVLGLEMGADDYLVKPFSMKELVARCKVGLRRLESQIEGPTGYTDENFEIEFDAYLLRYKGEEIRLTHKEFELVRYMVERAGRVLTRERLLDRVWGQDADVDARSIDAHVRRLRAKLGPARHHVETVVGIGYRFVR